jgi:ribosomal protein S18 acetylase RimI-like enzyme
MPDDNQRRRFLERVYSERSLQRSIENEATVFYVAHDGEQVVGLAHMGSPLTEECTDRKEIHRLLVHPDFVRQGIGQMFIEAMVAHYKSDLRVRQFFVYVPPTDEARAAFYRKLGYQRLSTQDRDGERYFYYNVP